MSLLTTLGENYYNQLKNDTEKSEQVKAKKMSIFSNFQDVDSIFNTVIINY